MRRHIPLCSEEIDWEYNMQRLIKWAIKKSFEQPYPFPVSPDYIKDMILNCTKFCLLELEAIGEITYTEVSRAEKIDIIKSNPR